MTFRNVQNFMKVYIYSYDLVNFASLLKVIKLQALHSFQVYFVLLNGSFFYIYLFGCSQGIESSSGLGVI